MLIPNNDSSSVNSIYSSRVHSVYVQNLFKLQATHSEQNLRYWSYSIHSNRLARKSDLPKDPAVKSCDHRGEIRSENTKEKNSYSGKLFGLWWITVEIL